MLTKTGAIVLRSFKYGESKIIVDFLTLSEGRLSCIVTVPKSSKAGIRKQWFQPMTVLDIEYDMRGGARLGRIRNARMAMPYATVPFEPYKLSIALFIAEFLYYATRAEQQNPNLFAYIRHSMAWLDGCARSYSNFHLVFMIRLTRFIGFFPNVDDYHAGYSFDMRQACFTPYAPLHSDCLCAGDASRMVSLMRMNYESMHLFRMSHEDRNRIADLILRYYRLHVPGFPELRSLQVMKELWKTDG